MWTRAASYLVLACLALLLGWLLEASDERSDEAADVLLMAILVTPLVVAHARLAPEALRERAFRPLARVWTGVLAGAAAGSVLGVGLRIGMRAVALLAGQPTTFTVGGTIFVLGIGVFFGGSFGGLFAAVHRWLPERVGGAVFGFLLGALFWFPFFDAAARDLRDVVSEPVIALLTTLLSALWLGYGMVLAWLLGRSRPGRA